MSESKIIRIIVEGGSIDGKTTFIAPEPFQDVGVFTYKTGSPAGVFDIASLLGTPGQAVAIAGMTVKCQSSVIPVGSTLAVLSPGSEEAAVIQVLGNTSGVFPEAYHVLGAGCKLVVTIADTDKPCGPYTIQMKLTPFSGDIESVRAQRGPVERGATSWKSLVLAASGAGSPRLELLPPSLNDDRSGSGYARKACSTGQSAAFTGVARSDSASLSKAVVIVEGDGADSHPYTLATSFAAIGEDQDANTSSTADTFVAAAGTFSEIDVLPLLEGLEAGDLFGVQIENDSPTHSFRVYGLLLDWNR